MDELEDNFEPVLEALLRQYGHIGFDMAERATLIEGAIPEVGLVALRAAAHVKDHGLGGPRIRFARDALHSKIPEFRYGALDVLADSDDRSAAVTTLKDAAHRENIAALRQDMERLVQVLDK